VGFSRRGAQSHARAELLNAKAVTIANPSRPNFITF
jgi:hypothetical protein